MGRSLRAFGGMLLAFGVFASTGSWAVECGPSFARLVPSWTSGTPFVPDPADGRRPLTGVLRLIPDGNPGLTRDVNLVFVIDDSGSMDHGNPSRRLQVSRALLAALDVVPPEATISLVQFGERGRVLIEGARRDAPELKTLIRSLAEANPGETTQLARGLKKARKILKRSEPGQQRAVFLLIDGTTEGEGKALAVAEKLRGSDVGMAAVVVGDEDVHSFMNGLVGIPPTETAFSQGVAPSNALHYLNPSQPASVVNLIGRVVRNLSNPAMRDVQVTITPSPGYSLVAVNQVTPYVRRLAPNPSGPSQFQLGTIPFSASALHLQFDGPLASGEVAETVQAAKVQISWTAPDGRRHQRELAYTINAVYGEPHQLHSQPVNAMVRLQTNRADFGRAFEKLARYLGEEQPVESSDFRNIVREMQRILDRPGGVGSHQTPAVRTLVDSLARGDVSLSVLNQLRQFTVNPNPLWSELAN